MHPRKNKINIVKFLVETVQFYNNPILLNIFFFDTAMHSILTVYFFKVNEIRCIYIIEILITNNVAY